MLEHRPGVVVDPAVPREEHADPADECRRHGLVDADVGLREVRVRLPVVALEAAAGPIGLLEPGDVIEIDIPAHQISVRLSDEELAQRKKQWQPRPPRYKTGCLAKYAAMATSADTGAVLKWE